jgi:hypothetical protein
MHPKQKKIGFLKKEEWHTQNEKIGDCFLFFSKQFFWVFLTRKNTHSQNNKIGFCIQARTMHPKGQKGFFWVCTRKNNGRCYGWVIDLRGGQLSSDWFRWTSQLDSTNFDWISFVIRIRNVGFSPPNWLSNPIIRVAKLLLLECSQNPSLWTLPIIHCWYFC